MIRIISFREEYLKYFSYDGIEAELAEGLNEREIAKGYAQLGPAYMAIMEDELKVVAIGGIFPVFEGTGQAWLFFNNHAKVYEKTIFKPIRNYLASIIKDLGFRQVQYLCLEDSFESKNLGIHLGFQKKELWRRFTIGV